MTRILLAPVLLTPLVIACSDQDTQPTGPTTGTTGTAGSDTSTGHAEDGHSETGVDPTRAPTTSTTAPDPTTTGTELTGDPNNNTGCPFICVPDSGPHVEDCDVFQQDCGRDHKCVGVAVGGGSSWNAARCVKVTGDKLPGDTCTAEGGLNGIDDCGFGSTCWDVDDETHQGVCVALCTGTPDAPVCAAETACAITNEGVLNLCLPICDPLVQDCAGDDLCVAVVDVFICTLDASGDGGQLNTPCEFLNSCDKGLVCVPTGSASSACAQESQGCCQPFCTFMEGQDGDCPNPDQKCVPWFDPMMEIPPGFEDIGICSIPM